MTDRFVVTGHEVAGIEGLADYPFAVIEHPIAGNPDDELHAKAERAVATIVSVLMEREKR